MGVFMTLFQETWRDHPFWMLAGCVLLNRATWKRAEPVLNELRDTYEMPVGVFAAPRKEIARIVRPLGMQDTRAKRLHDLAKAWIELPKYPRTREAVLALPGCGAYAADSYQIFVLKKPCEPTDKKLRAYVREHPHKSRGIL